MTRILTATLALLLFSGIGAFAADDHKHEHGKTVEVGEVTIGTTKVEVELAGAVTAGKEVHVELHLDPATPAPKAVRVWIGIESGRGSEKAKAEAEAEAAQPGGYEAHVDVPSPLPEGSNIWVSIEPASGDVVKGSLQLPSPDAKAHDHKNHDHKK
jgi:hypothetical protein